MAGTTELNVLVLARADDAALSVLGDRPAGVRVVVGDRIDALAKEAAHADVLLAASPPAGLLAEVWPLATGVRWVHSLAAGVDHLFFPELAASPVPLTNSRGVFSRALAEFALAGVLFFAKDVRRLLAQQAQRRWQAYEPQSVHGRTMVIVGFGDIGRAVGRLARTFGMRVVGVRRAGGSLEGADEVVATTHLDRTLSRADVLVVAAPLTPETRHLIDAARLAVLPRHAVVINVGRGPVVDQAALVDALRSGRIHGAALDVFETEPLPPDDALWTLDNVLICPHSADHTAGWREEAMELFFDNLRRFLAGEELRNPVDKRLGY